MVLNAAGHKVAGWDAKTMESQLSNKQMDNQLLVHLLKYHFLNFLKLVKLSKIS